MWRFRPQTAWVRILRHVSATMGQGPASIGSVYFAQLDPHGPIPDLSICFDILYNYNYTFAALINLVITFMLQRKMLLYTDVLMTKNTVCVIKKRAIIRRGCLDIQINKTFQLFTISFNHHQIWIFNLCRPRIAVVVAEDAMKWVASEKKMLLLLNSSMKIVILNQV